MFRNYLCTSLMLVFGLLSYGQTVMKVKVVSVPLYMTATFDIPCGLFDKSFTDEKKKVLIKYGSALNRVKILLKMFQPTKWKSMDVRGKLIIYYRKTSTTICFDEFGHFLKQGKFYENQALFKFLIDNRIVDK